VPVALAAALCGPSWGAGPAAQPLQPLQPLTIDEAVADVVHWGPRLSPSGRYLALLLDHADRTYITITDLEDATAQPVTHSIPHGVIKWIEWDSDERLLAAATFWADSRGKAIPLDSDQRGIRVVRMVALDRNGGNFVMLFQDNLQALYTVNLAQVTDFLPNDPQHIIVPAWNNNRIDLFRVDTFTGGSERIGKGESGTFYWFTDKDGYPAFRIDKNWTGWYAYIYARKGPGNVPADDLEWEKVDEIPLKDDNDDEVPDFYPLHPGPEPSTYYVSARPDGADTSGIYLYDFIAKKYLKTLATEPGIDIRKVVVDDDYGYLGVEYYADRKVVRMADPKLQAQFNALDKYFGREVDVYLSDFSRDFGTWLLYVVGPRDRGSYHVYRRKDKFVKEVAYRFPALDMNRLGPAQVLRYRARDGLEIMGYLTTPPGPKPGSQAPLIILPHGGPEIRDTFEYDSLVQLLATRGYQVFQPNFRGSSGFGKRFAEAGRRQYGGTMQDDLTDALRFLVEKGYAAEGRACIVGGSYGGYAALAGATQTPDLYRCAVSIAGVSDLPLQLKAYKKEFRGFREGWKYVKEKIGDPDDDKAMLEAHSPVRLAGAVKIPILLIHGEDDGRVPIEHSERMDKALRKAGKDVRFVRIAEAGHAFYGDDLKKVYAPILEFLDTHLPVNAAPAATETKPQP
jgi:dipeptidyl aminopeptidase/acylaminoacyl peptidase